MFDRNIASVTLPLQPMMCHQSFSTRPSFIKLQLTPTSLTRNILHSPHHQPTQASSSPAQLRPLPATQLALDFASRDKRTTRAPLFAPFVSMAEQNVEKGDQGRSAFRALPSSLSIRSYYALYSSCHEQSDFCSHTPVCRPTSR